MIATDQQTTQLIILIALAHIVALPVLYYAFAAICSFQRAMEAGKITTAMKALAMPLLVFGFILDWYLNSTVAAIVALDPFYFGTISNRYKKYNEDPNEWSWRKAQAKWLEKLLDPLDPSGNHI